MATVTRVPALYSLSKDHKVGQGQVVARGDHGSERVRFSVAGVEHEFVNPAAGHRVGDSVEVFYSPNEPDNAALGELDGQLRSAVQFATVATFFLGTPLVSCLLLWGKRRPGSQAESPRQPATESVAPLITICLVSAGTLIGAAAQLRAPDRDWMDCVVPAATVIGCVLMLAACLRPSLRKSWRELIQMPSFRTGLVLLIFGVLIDNISRTPAPPR